MIGRKPRRNAKREPTPPDPAIEARQTRAFDLSISGISNTSIAKMLGCHRHAVAKDIQVEGERRAHERAGDRENAIARAVARYEGLIGAATLRQQTLRNDGLQAAKWSARARFHDLVRLEGVEIRKLQHAIEQVQGLHAPLSVDASTTNITLNALALAQDNALAAFANVDPAMRSVMRQAGRDYRKAQTIDVTPGAPDIRDDNDVP
jgi:hypothetical protein